ncbi:NAD(P)/FAD-dependent oxidoreductase [Arthrobacter sp.]|uniref:FAD-dependent oxidoreductase n=1 Tax=Arthrobacter sp. TaxID=1667 RepID=UPI00289EE0FC|nr:NAD(P)/FAD-dependent oxidoreductase [Arthrobacter sp.]
MSPGTGPEGGPLLDSGQVLDVDVAIVGGGPVGLALAILLQQQGLRTAVLERRTTRSSHSRAIGIHPPGLAALEGTGITEQLTSEGVQIRHGAARTRDRRLVSIRFTRTATRYPYVLALPQERTETILEDRLRSLAPTALHRGHTVTALVDTGSSVILAGISGADGGTGAVRGTGADVGTGTVGEDAGFAVHAAFVVAADGARSPLRGLLGAAVEGKVLPDHYLMGDFPDTTGDGALGVLYLEPEGIVESFPLPAGKRRWVAHTRTLLAEADAKLLATTVQERTGQQLDTAGNSMLSAFSVRTALARQLVHGRTVLIGDAAHEVSPIGGQGLTLGWLDAAELAPLLASGVRGVDIRGQLAQFDRRRRRAARTASAQARLNMALGRPLPPPIMRARNAALAALFRAPQLGDLVARRFTMQ